MRLDLRKLKHAAQVLKADGFATVAQCPACVEQGADKTGNHLIIYRDGRFGCVVHPGDTDHRQRIFALVGMVDALPAETSHKPPAGKPCTVQKRTWHIVLPPDPGGTCAVSPVTDDSADG